MGRQIRLLVIYAFVLLHFFSFFTSAGKIESSENIESACGKNTKTLTTVTDPNLTPFPNVGFFGYGYDVVKGSSFSNTRDTGFIRPIFLITYTQNRSWNSWSVPDDASASTLTSCLVSGQYVLSSSGFDYQRNLQESGALTFDLSSIPLIGPLLQNVATGSEDFSSKFDTTGDSEYVYVGTYATCEAYQITLDVNPSPSRPLTSDFVQTVAAINPSDVGTLYNFINGYGTHYVEQMIMGGESYAYSSVLTEDYKTLQLQGVDLPSAINLLQLLNLGVNVQTDDHYTDMLKLQNVTKSFREQGAPVPIPPCPDGNPLDVSKWQAAVGLPSGNPMPIGITLLPIFDLLTPAVFPNDTAILEKQAAVITFLNNVYCGMVPNCGYMNPNKGLVAYFWGQDCPTNWTNFEPASGRAVVSVTNASSAGYAVGTALEDLQEPKHYHSLQQTFILHPQLIDLRQSSSGINLADQFQPFQAITANSSSGYAFLQLNLCKYDPQPYAYADVNMPIGSVAYFDALDCPANWVPLQEAQGRILVPSNVSGVYPSQDPPVIPGQPFSHRHPYSVTWQPASQPVEASIYNQDTESTADPVTVTDKTSAGEDYGLPYYSALTCTAQVGNYTTNAPDFMVIFTTSAICPTNWFPIGRAFSGHIPIAVTDNGTPNFPLGNVTNGIIPPASSNFIANHSHNFVVAFNTHYTAYEGTTGPYPNYWAQADFITIPSVTGDADAGIPYVSVLACVSG